MSLICFFWLVAPDPIRVSQNHCQGWILSGQSSGSSPWRGGRDKPGLSHCPSTEQSLWGHQGSPSPAHLVPPWEWAEASLGPGPALGLDEARGQAGLGCGLTGIGADMGAEAVGWTSEGLLVLGALDTFQSFTDPNFVLKTWESYPLAQ